MKININNAKKRDSLPRFTRVDYCSDDAMSALLDYPGETYKRIKYYYDNVLELSQDSLRQDLLKTLKENKESLSSLKLQEEIEKHQVYLKYPDDDLTDALEKLIFNPSVIFMIHKKSIAFTKLRCLYHIARGTSQDNIPYTIRKRFKAVKKEYGKAKSKKSKQEKKKEKKEKTNGRKKWIFQFLKDITR